MRIAVVGAGVTGLGAALYCARDGHDVVLLERDATPLPASPDEAFEWNRRGAPQVRHSHAFLARLRNLLRDTLPDVRDALLRAGATELGWGDARQEPLEGDEPMAGDEDLAMLCCRRTTFEWVLRRAALDTARVDLRDGVAVTGLEATGKGPPRVTGVETNGGTIEADIVVDATGRPSRMPDLLKAHGVVVHEDVQPSGIVYLSRFYRLADPDSPPAAGALIAGDLQYLKFAIFRGDNGTFSITLAHGTGDDVMRGLRDRGKFERALPLIPAVAPWISPDTATPVSPVHYMGGLINRHRRYLRDGQPAVLGLVALGDASVCTNPLYGRGCALGMMHAHLFAEALTGHGDDPEALACTLDEATNRELVPWYRAAVAQDAAGQAAEQGELPPEQQAARDVLLEGLLPAVREDPVVARAWFRSFNLLTTPDALMGDPDLLARVMASYNRRHERPPPEPVGLSREEFLAKLGE